MCGGLTAAGWPKPVSAPAAEVTGLLEAGVVTPQPKAPEKPVLVIMFGPPGCGKSWVLREFMRTEKPAWSMDDFVLLCPVHHDAAGSSSAQPEMEVVDQGEAVDGGPSCCSCPISPQTCSRECSLQKPSP